MRATTTGKCPHCRIAVRFEEARLFSGASNFGVVNPISIVTDSDWSIRLRSSACPSCGKPILLLEALRHGKENQAIEQLLWPDTANRPVPAEVEIASPALAADFHEAAIVLSKSKKASAALSRRCLQFILRERAGTKSRDLVDQIEEVLASLPTELASNLDAIRHVGNFAAHPIKSKQSGEIVEVEEGEAEWLLDVLEELFDYYYVAPSAAAARREALNKKLIGAGKPPLKAP